MDIGIVKPIAIEEEMQSSYLDYAMSVIVSRALPDVRDGLKPVHRRILVTLHDLGLTHTAHFRKSAKICGDVSGNYHPHGEAIVYPSMARLAQDFNMRYPLVDGQGNFGSIDGDNPAAMRYTEARMTAIAEEMLADIDKDTVDWVDNYDSTRKEPVVLPARIPNLLINGSAGIAVGMATNIPPHNLGEICDAAAYMINRFGVPVEEGVPFEVLWARVHGTGVDQEAVARALQKPGQVLKQKITARAAAHGRKGLSAETLLDYVDEAIEVDPDELLAIVKGPDFPTGGLILGLEGIKSAYTTGHGRVVVRAKAHIEEMRGGRYQIVVNELPYQVNKAALLEKIAELVRDKRIEGISDLRDESDRQGMRIVIEIKRDARPQQVLKALYKHTAMQTAFSVNMLALVDGQPRTLTLKATLLHFLDHRQKVVVRRTRFELDKARQRMHILEGLKIALDNLDAVIATIRKSRDADTARKALVSNFKLSEIQAQAILDMQLRRLAALERQKILEELAEVRKLVAYLEDLLANPLKILYLIRDELVEIKNKYGDARRTRILAEEPAEIAEEELIPDVEIVIGLSQRGYIRRLPLETYRPQRKARGAGTGAIITREDDALNHLVVTSSLANVLLFTDRGRVYQMKAHEIPEASRQSRGLPVNNFVNLEPNEAVTAMVPVRAFDQGKYLVMQTRGGDIKRIELTEFASVRPSGILAMNLAEGDELRWVRQTDGRDEIVVATEGGQCIRFSESEVRATGRASGGVRAVKLGEGDRVAGFDLVGRGTDLIIATERGQVKRTALAEYPVQGRGGSGVRGFKVLDKTGPVVSARVVSESDEIMVATAEGTVFRTSVSAVPRKGRATSGIGLVKVAPSDRVVAVACLRANGNGGEPAEPGGVRPRPRASAPSPTPDGVKPASKLPRVTGVEARATTDGQTTPATAAETPVAKPAESAPQAEPRPGSPAQPAGKRARGAAAEQLPLAPTPAPEKVEAKPAARATTTPTPEAKPVAGSSPAKAGPATEKRGASSGKAAHASATAKTTAKAPAKKASASPPSTSAAGKPAAKATTSPEAKPAAKTGAAATTRGKSATPRETSAKAAPGAKAAAEVDPRPKGRRQAARE